MDNQGEYIEKINPDDPKLFWIFRNADFIWSPMPIDDRSQTALLLAATIGHDTIVSLLVDSGANKEAADNNEQTALHHASNGHDFTVQLLIGTLGVDKKAMDDNQRTALLPGRSDLDGD